MWGRFSNRICPFLTVFSAIFEWTDSECRTYQGTLALSLSCHILKGIFGDKKKAKKALRKHPLPDIPPQVIFDP